MLPLQRRVLATSRVRAIFTRKVHAQSFDGAGRTDSRETLVPAEDGIYSLQVYGEDAEVTAILGPKKELTILGGQPYEWDEDGDRQAILYAVPCPSSSGVAYFSTHHTLMRLNTDDSTEVVAGSWDDVGDRDGTGAEALINAPLCLALTGPIPPPPPPSSAGGDGDGDGVAAPAAGATTAAGAAMAAHDGGFLFFGEGGERTHVRRARLPPRGSRSALATEVVTLPGVETDRPISALAYDCARGVLYMASAEVVYRISDPLGPAPRMEAVAGHDWDAADHADMQDEADGDGRRDGLGVAARFFCICDIMLDSQGLLYVTDLGHQVGGALPSVRLVDPRVGGQPVRTLPVALGAATSASLSILPGNWLGVYEWGGSRLQLLHIPGLEPCLMPPQPPPPPAADLAGLADDWGALLSDPQGTGSDIVVTVGDCSFQAHRLVLSARCEYFRRQFAGGCRDSRAREVTLVDADPSAFSQLLRHLYTGCVDFPESALRPLLELADRLLLPRVAERVQRQLLEAATPATVVGDMLWAESMGFGELQAGLKAFYLQHEGRVLAVAGDAVRAMMATHPDLFFDLHVAGVRRAHPGA